MVTHEQITNAILTVASEMAADRGMWEHDIVADAMAGDEYVTAMSSLPVSLAAAFFDLAALLGVTLPPPIAAALNQPVSIVRKEEASASSPFQA